MRYAIGYISFRPRVPPEKPYQWKLFLYSGGKEMMLSELRPIPLYSSVKEAKEEAGEYAKAFGISIDSWRGEEY